MKNCTCFSALLVPVLLFYSTNCIAKQQRVNTGKHETISEAITRCDQGDTLTIPPGLYKESTIVVDKPLVLIGERTPVLDGQAKNEIMAIKSDGVSITGLKFQNPGRSDMTDMAALRVFNCRFVTIRSNIIEHAYFGIYLERSKQCLIYNNTIHGSETSEMFSGNGIHCWSCDSLRIFQNTVTSQRDGIYFEFVTNSVVLGNYSHNNFRYGLHFMFSNHDVYTSNIFEANGAGVAVMYTNGVQMLHNTFRYNWGAASYGLLLKDISDSRVAGNIFEENTIAIYMEGSSRMIICNNNFTSNGWAARVQASCMDIEITRNNFVGNSFDIATNSDVVLSTFDNNHWDKYEGYDINRDGIGDVPYRPVGLYAIIIERIPSALMLYRSPVTALIDKAEKAIPGMTPVELRDHKPIMKSVPSRYD